VHARGTVGYGATCVTNRRLELSPPPGRPRSELPLIAIALRS
jgi:hypothetical protein